MIRDTPDRTGAAAAELAARVVRERIGAREPVVAVVLGSGLGRLVERIANASRVPFPEIPGFHATNIAGHTGELIAGTIGGRDVLVLAGRFHMYEGHSARTAGFPVRVLHALGARALFVSNAAGGIRSSLVPGDLMIIRDHLNLTFRNPIVGAVEPTDLRFPDLSAVWSPRLVALLHASATRVGVPVQSGVYAGLLGPSYETPAEVGMLATVGADAVGMSTVPEAIVAAALRMDVAGISLITNMAAGRSGDRLSHAEVLAAGESAAVRFADVVTEFVARV